MKHWLRKGLHFGRSRSVAAECNFREINKKNKKEKRETCPRETWVCRSSLWVRRRSWKRVRRACGVKVRPRRVWAKCAVLLRVGGYVHDRLSTYFFALLLPPPPPQPRYSRWLPLVISAQREPVLICPRARVIHAAPIENAAKVKIDTSARETKICWIFGWQHVRPLEKKRNHCAAISSTIHFTPEFCDSNCDQLILSHILLVGHFY